MCRLTRHEIDSIQSLLPFASERERLELAELLESLEKQASEQEWLDQRTAAEASLHEYVRQAWHVIEPDTEFVDNWHIAAMCEHLEHSARTPRYDLLMIVPPGCMKSLVTCVFWPTWVWGPYGWPEARWLFGSYSQTLSTRDSVRCRELINSKWYQDRWGHVFQFAADQDQKTYFANRQGGWRLATSPTGRGTGEHPDFIVADDPQNVEQSESDVQRQVANNWWSGTITTRGASRGARKTIIMQRLHKMDLSGFVLQQGGYDHLCLPMEYEPDHPHLSNTALGFKDPRTEKGELLWPALFGPDAVETIKRGLLSALKITGQLQQRPTQAEGSIFKAEKFQILDSSAWPAFEPGDLVGVYWDKAATQDGGDWTAGVLMLLKKDGRIIVVDCSRGQWGIDTRNDQIEMRSRIAQGRYRKLRVWFEVEGGASGKESELYTIRRLKGLRVEGRRKGISKLDDWEPWASQVNAGNVFLVPGDWNADFIQEHIDAPNGEHDDQIDAAAGVFNMLTARQRANLDDWLKAGAF